LKNLGNTLIKLKISSFFKKLDIGGYLKEIFSSYLVAEAEKMS
jgi:hypothetical protein